MVSALVLVLVGVAGAGPAFADAGADAKRDSCVDDLERDGTALIFDVTWAMERTRLAAEDKFVAIRAARAQLDAFTTGPDVAACERTGAEAREQIEQWITRFARPALAKSRQQMDEICTSQTFTALRAREDVETAMADNELATAARAADALEYGLTHGAAVTDCPPMRERVDELLHDYIPGVRATIALPKVTADMEEAFTSVLDPWMEAQDALATEGKSIQRAPSLFELADGQQAFRGHLRACLHHAASLRSLGVADDYGLRTPGAPAGVGTNLRDAETICRGIADSADELFEQVAAHNQAYAAEQKRKWEYVHIKGWDMWVVYNAHGRPATTTTVRGGEIEWTYRELPTAGACTHYRFDARGKQLGKRRTRCAEPIALNAR